jgi:RNA polymerase sigma-70 factor (ECF subfamily)
MPRPSSQEARDRLERLYRDHSASVYRCARVRLSPDDAQDVVSDVFVIAWQRMPQIPEYELAWLLRVSRNVIANRLRSDTRRRVLAERIAAQEGTGAPDHGPAVAARAEIDWALARLGERDREVLQLLLTHDLSTPELAVALGCRPNTAAQRAKRARDRLAGIYADAGPILALDADVNPPVDIPTVATA